MTDAQGGARSIQVAVRVRPLNKRERDLNEDVCVQVDRAGHIEVEKRPFAFDFSYGMDSDQTDVYNDLGRNLLDNAADGYNSCLFAYGQTGAGKSWSILGDQASETQRGLLPRICEGIFSRLSEANPPLEEFRISCTYLEIYNEKIKDLLSESERSLEVRQLPTGGVCVPGLTERQTERYDDVHAVLQDGDKHRSVASTAMNAVSSRSHAVFTINVAQTLKDQRRRKAQLHIVDLAGSERQKKTGAEGDKLKEGSAINQSLTVLGQVIFALAAHASEKKAKTHVPFRNSKLTYLLSDSLSGNSKTVMIAACSPAKGNYEETLNTLRFAQSVKKVKTQAVKNEGVQQNKDVIIKELMVEVEALRAKLSAAPVAPVASIVEEQDDLHVDSTTRPAIRKQKTLSEQVEEELGADPWAQQHCDFPLQVDLIERCLAHRDNTADAGFCISESFGTLRAEVEHMNFIMSWMMNYDFIPHAGEMSRWLAVINWQTSPDPPHLSGNVMAQLWTGDKLTMECNPQDFHKISTQLEAQYEACVEKLNQQEPVVESSKEELAPSGVATARTPAASSGPRSSVGPPAVATSDVSAGRPRGGSAAAPPTATAAAAREPDASRDEARQAELDRLRGENSKLREELASVQQQLADARKATSSRGGGGALQVPVAHSTPNGAGVSPRASARKLHPSPARGRPADRDQVHAPASPYPSAAGAKSPLAPKRLSRSPMPAGRAKAVAHAPAAAAHAPGAVEHAPPRSPRPHGHDDARARWPAGAPDEEVEIRDTE